VLDESSYMYRKMMGSVTVHSCHEVISTNYQLDATNVVLLKMFNSTLCFGRMRPSGTTNLNVQRMIF
jgi:hypothetical protein